MAMKIIYTCDRCKKERNTSRCALYTDHRREKMGPYWGSEETGEEPKEHPDHVDLCVSCMNELVAQMRGEQ